MAQQTSNSATMGEFQTRGDDFLHLKNSQGTVVGGIDNTGTGFGSLQGGGGFTPPPTKTFYVDINRTDSYTADGSLLKPFKTIMAAVNQVIANGDNSATVPYAVDIAVGTYPELITLQNTALVFLIFVGHGKGTALTGGIQSTSNNSNLAQVVFQDLSAGTPTTNISVALSGSGNFLSSALIFWNSDVNVPSSPGWSQTGGNVLFYNCTVSFAGNNLSFSGVVIQFLRSSINGSTTAPGFNLTNSSTLSIQHGSRNSLVTVTIDSTSTFALGNGARQDGAIVVNGSFTNRLGTVSGAITVNNGGTYQELGGFHTGTLTINAGGNYTQTGVLGTGGIVLGAAAPVVPSGEVGLGNGTSASASAGAATLPANPLGFLVANVGGTTVKIPYYGT